MEISKILILSPLIFKKSKIIISDITGSDYHLRDYVHLRDQLSRERILSMQLVYT